MKKQKGILKKLGAFTLALAVLGSTLWQYPGTVSAAEEELEQTVNAENTEETEAVVSATVRALWILSGETALYAGRTERI